MGEQRNLAPGHAGFDLAGSDADQQAGADQAGIERIMRLGAVRDDGAGVVDHALGDVGMVVEL